MTIIGIFQASLTRFGFPLRRVPSCWIQTEYNNQNSSGTFYSVGSESAGPTAINLLSFTATGRGAAMEVAWQTAQEAQNKGFDLYRGTSPSGPWEKLNTGLIPSGSVSGEGVSYTFVDTGVSRGRLYYYRLEDVDVSGKHTPHGPVCVDWDADGMPDDWEIAHGLNPAVNDAGLDSDGDGLVNRLEYARRHRPLQSGHGRRRDSRWGGEEEPGLLGRSRQPRRGCECAGARLR